MIFLLAGLIIGHRCLGDVGVGKLLSGFRYDRNSRSSGSSSSGGGSSSGSGRSGSRRNGGSSSGSSK